MRRANVLVSFNPPAYSETIVVLYARAVNPYGK